MPNKNGLQEVRPDWDNAEVVLRVPVQVEYKDAGVRELTLSLRQLAALLVEHIEAEAFGREDSISLHTTGYGNDMPPSTIYEELKLIAIADPSA